MFDRRYCTPAAPSTSTTKQIAVVDRALAEGLIDIREDRGFDAELTWRNIMQTHSPDYVKAVMNGYPRMLAESQGFQWSAALADSVARIWSGHIFATRLALTEGLILHPVSGAHHALYGRGSAFCTFNFLIGAGATLLGEGKVQRVGIIDLDAHLGNGTLKLADDRFSVFDISRPGRVSCQSANRMVFGAANEREYFEDLRRLPEWFDANKPDVVEYQAGMDCHEDDPLGKIAGMNAEALEQRDRFVIHEAMQRCIPIVVNLAGGYQADGSTIALHVQTARIMSEALNAVRELPMRSHGSSD